LPEVNASQTATATTVAVGIPVKSTLALFVAVPLDEALKDTAFLA
jgi:hypothetical protein